VVACASPWAAIAAALADECFVDAWSLQALQEPQWINCDVRNFDWSILGKFGVIMTDPPWHIRQVRGVVTHT